MGLAGKLNAAISAAIPLLMNKYFQYKQIVNQEIQKIPKKNRAKFSIDYLKLIQLAQKDDYENFEF